MGLAGHVGKAPASGTAASRDSQAATPFSLGPRGVMVGLYVTGGLVCARDRRLSINSLLRDTALVSAELMPPRIKSEFSQLSLLPGVTTGSRSERECVGWGSWEGSLKKDDTTGRDTFRFFLFSLCCCLNCRCNGWCTAAILDPEVTLHTRMAGQKTDGAWLHQRQRQGTAD